MFNTAFVSCIYNEARPIVAVLEIHNLADNFNTRLHLASIAEVHMCNRYGEKFIGTVSDETTIMPDQFALVSKSSSVIDEVLNNNLDIYTAVVETAGYFYKTTTVRPICIGYFTCVNVNNPQNLLTQSVFGAFKAEHNSKVNDLNNQLQIVHAQLTQADQLAQERSHECKELIDENLRLKDEDRRNTDLIIRLNKVGEIKQSIKPKPRAIIIEPPSLSQQIQKFDRSQLRSVSMIDIKK